MLFRSYLIASKSFLCNIFLINSINDPDSPHEGLKHSHAPFLQPILKLGVCLLLWKGQNANKLSLASLQTSIPRDLTIDFMCAAEYCVVLVSLALYPLIAMPSSFPHIYHEESLKTSMFRH